MSNIIENCFDELMKVKIENGQEDFDLCMDYLNNWTENLPAYFSDDGKDIGQIMEDVYTEYHNTSDHPDFMDWLGRVEYDLSFVIGMRKRDPKIIKAFIKEAM